MGILSFEYRGQKHQYEINKSLMIERGYIKCATKTELFILKRFAHSIILQIEEQYKDPIGVENGRQTKEYHGF